MQFKRMIMLQFYKKCFIKNFIENLVKYLFKNLQVLISHNFFINVVAI